MRLLVFTLIMTISLGAQSPRASQAAHIAGSTEPSLWVTPLVLDFGPVGVGYSGNTLTVTITNTGDDTLTNFAGGGVSSPFSASQNCAAGVAPGGSCQYFFTFSPTEVGLFTTTSNSGTNAGPFSIELHGEGVGAGLHVTPLSLDFGSIYVPPSAGTQNGPNAANTQVVTVRNTGLAELTNFAGGGVDSPFSGAQNCAGGVLPGESCQYFFGFSPTETGVFTTTSNSSTNAGSFSVDLLGRGRSIIYGSGQRVTPRSLDFGPVGIGFSGETQVVTITNQSMFSTITDWMGGGVSAPFGASQNCASGLAPLESCQFYYTFNPTETGVFSTTSNVTNSFGSFTIKLQGEGVGADVSVSQLVLDFGSVTPGTMSAQQLVTIKNTGLAELINWAGGGLSSPFHVAQDCAGGVDPGDTCHYYFTFSPDEWGRFTATSNSSTSGGSFSVQVIGGLELPSISMFFSPKRIDPGEITTLQYTIHNPNPSATLYDVNFVNAFPSGMSVSDPIVYSYSGECGVPTFNPNVGATTIYFYDATILGGDDCVITLSVTASPEGDYTNTTSLIYSSTGNGDAATASLHVGMYETFIPLIDR